MTSQTPSQKNTFGDPERLIKEITKNRENYINYNISRLRELIRYLSEKKLKLFNTIPLIVHLNSPDFPGYVESDHVVHGIHNFQGSGFWNQGLKMNGIIEKDALKYTTEHPCIFSLFHIGSAGTLTQSVKSDFDYWVIVDRDRFDEKKQEVLQTKLKRIEEWCKNDFNQEVTFFIHDLEHIRHNDFATVDSSSFGLAPKTILKEEFYRTFIMIGGRIPFWAVFPPNLSDRKYNYLIKIISDTPELSILKDEYIDIGNLVEIDVRECLGVILWQVFKARNDPVKSLIKSSLISNYYFFQDNENPLLCNYIKSKFHETQLDNHHLDPYALVFKTILNFYQGMGDGEGYDLIMQSILLRLCGFPLVLIPPQESPKGRLLKKYIGEWKMDKKKVAKLMQYQKWPEFEKRAFDEKLFSKLSFLFELILRNQDDKLMGIEMGEFDRTILKNRTAAFLQKKDGKLPKCSIYLNKKKDVLRFFISDSGHESNHNGWGVYNISFSKEKSSETIVFKSNRFLQSMGWVLSNDLCNMDETNISFDVQNELLSDTDFTELLDEIYLFMKDDAHNDVSVYSSDPLWHRILLLFEPDQAVPEKFPYSAGILIKNNWGEYFFDTIDLSSIEKTDEKCYKISKVMGGYLKKAPHATIKYKISFLTNKPDEGIIKKIELNMKRFIDLGSDAEKTEKTNDFSASSDEIDPSRPILDLL